MSELKIKDVQENLLHKTLFDEKGVAYGISQHERDDRNYWIKTIEEIQDYPFHGVIVPITPVENVNIFQWFLAAKLQELQTSEIRHMVFHRDEGYEEKDRDQYVTITSFFLRHLEASGVDSSRSTGSSHLTRTPEHRELKEILLRFDLRQSVRLTVEELHLAALYAIKEKKTPFLLIGYNEKSLVDIILRFLRRGQDELRTLVPIYLPTVNMKRNLILVKDAVTSPTTKPETSDLREKMEDELYMSDHPEELLAQIYCYLLDRNKPLNAETVAEVAKDIGSFQELVITRLEGQGKEIVSAMTPGGIGDD